MGDCTAELPDDLKNMCLSFYLILIDRWNHVKSDKGFEINNNDNNSLILRGNGYPFKWRHAFGSTIICKGEIRIWRLTITNDHPNKDIPFRTCMFGIYDVNQERIQVNDRGFTDAYNGWAFYAYDGDKIHGNGSEKKRMRVHYAKGWDKYDIVTMTLDMTAKKSEYGILSFKINEQDYGIAYDNLPIDGNYSMAVSMYYKEDLQLCGD